MEELAEMIHYLKTQIKIHQDEAEMVDHPRELVSKSEIDELWEQIAEMNE